jgi:transcription initiation factor TFIID subunit 6
MQASARSALLALVEEHLANLIREAESVKRHCKRSRLHPDPLAGGDSVTANATAGTSNSTANSHNSTYNSSTGERMTVRRRLHAADINMALEMQGSEKLYGVPWQAAVDPDSNDSSNSNSSQVAVVNLKDFLQHSHMPAAPTEVALNMHWLAVDGVQPEIPQNPISSKSTSGVNGNVYSGASNNPAHVGSMQEEAADASGSVRVNRLQASLLSEELQLYFTRVCLAMELSSGGTGGSSQASQTATSASQTTAAAQMTLPQQQQQQQDAVIASVATDTGLQELVPFLVRYCQSELYWHAEQGHVEHCRCLVRLAVALLQNQHLHLELHLHELLPALMTCVVAKRLTPLNKSVSTNSSVSASTAVNKNKSQAAAAAATAAAANNHYALRREAAAALVHACRLFGDEYATLKARVLRTLCNAVAPDQALSSRYGGLVAISLFGTKAIDAFVLPVAANSWKYWQDRLAAVSSPGTDSANGSTVQDWEEASDIRMCQQAVLEAMGLFLQRVSDSEKAERMDWQDFEETFGDSLVAIQGGGETGAPSEYAMCFV